MDHFPGNWGNPRTRDDSLYSSHDYFPGQHAIGTTSAAQASPIAHTQSPIVTGTSVLGIKYKDGIMLAADMLASYGNLARFKDVERLLPVGDQTIVGASGDISDFQHITHMLNTLTTNEYDLDDGHKLGPKNVYEYMSRVMYGRRSKFNPLWNSLVIGGVKNGERFLGYVDLLGTRYESSTIATGYGSYIAQPILRKAVEGREDILTEDEARALMETCLRVLFYRDARSLNKCRIAVVDKAGIRIGEPFKLSTEWGFAEGIRGYGA